MAEITFIHRIEAPEFTAAINNLADAIRYRPVDADLVAKAITPPSAPAPVEAPRTPKTAGNPTPAPAQPTSPVSSAAAPTPAVDSSPAAEAAAPESAATVDATPAITFEMLTAAGSQLLTENKMPQLMQLLESFNTKALTMLKPEQYPAFADGLRALGARI